MANQPVPPRHLTSPAGETHHLNAAGASAGRYDKWRFFDSAGAPCSPAEWADEFLRFGDPSEPEETPGMRPVALDIATEEESRRARDEERMGEDEAERDFETLSPRETEEPLR